jgi:hypothetical protein
MAEKQMVGDEVAANRPTGPEVEVKDSATELVSSAPEPTDDEGAKIYKVMYPVDQFVVEGQPVVTTTGVRLTAEQAEEILPLAEASGVTIVEVTE